MANPIIQAQHLFQYSNQQAAIRALLALAADATGTNSISNNVGYWNAAGTFTSIFTPSAGAVDPRVVVSRDYGFFLTGILADQKKWNSTFGLSNWGIAKPTSAPIAIGTQPISDVFQANTEYTTMGILKDTNNNLQQLIGINADGSNSTPSPANIGTSGKGSPAWAQGGTPGSPGPTTTDGALLWQSRGPVGLWKANTFNNPFLGTVANPSVLYDPVTNALFYQNQGGGGTSGSVYPKFNATPGAITIDGSNRWLFISLVRTGTTPNGNQYTGAWQPSHVYAGVGGGTNLANAAITEPCSVASAYNATTNSFNGTILLHQQDNAGGGTSSASFASLVWATTPGAATDDGQLTYICLGPATWAASTTYQQWVGQGIVFGAIFDTTSSTYQVAIQTGKSGLSIPTFSNVYAFQTPDGPDTLLWACVGQNVAWVATTKWFLPANGFQAPASVNSFGGARISDGTNVEACTNSGLSGGSAPAWNTTVLGTTTTGTATFTNIGPIQTTSGNVTLLKGRVYFVIFNNSKSGGASDVSPASGTTGAVSNGVVFISQIAVSTDPQVDTKTVLATADGGNQLTLFQVATIPNIQTTLVDSFTEPLLEAQPVWQDTDNAGISHGVYFNTPPPNGSFPIKYRGRLYMILGSFLFFSKSLSDMITSTGLIAGRYEECWPSANQLDISENTEAGRGLYTDGVVLYIGTQRHIRKIQGDGPFGPNAFTSPEIVFNEVGILNQDVWQGIYIEGTPAGAMWVTPDFRCIRSDFNTYDNVGIQIQTTLNSINTAAANTSWATYVGEGGYNFYVLAIPTGTSTTPDTLCVYNIATGRWFIWTPADKLRCGLYYANIAGIPRWLVNSLDGSIYLFDPLTVMDRQTTGDRVGITSTIRTVFNDLTDATMRKALNEVEVATTQPLTLTVEGASAESTFLNPNVVVAGGSLIQNIFGDQKLYLTGLPSFDRFYRLTFQDTSTINSSVNDVILSYYSMEAVPLHRN